jgi:hypothetical protein
LCLLFLQQRNLDHVFQHDNARCHVTRVCQAFWTRITSVFFLGRHYHREPKLVSQSYGVDYGLVLPPAAYLGVQIHVVFCEIRMFARPDVLRAVFSAVIIR